LASWAAVCSTSAERKLATADVVRELAAVAHILTSVAHELAVCLAPAAQPAKRGEWGDFAGQHV